MENANGEERKDSDPSFIRPRDDFVTWAIRMGLTPEQYQEAVKARLIKKPRAMAIRAEDGNPVQ